MAKSRHDHVKPSGPLGPTVKRTIDRIVDRGVIVRPPLEDEPTTDALGNPCPFYHRRLGGLPNDQGRIPRIPRHSPASQVVKLQHSPASRVFIQEALGVPNTEQTTTGCVFTRACTQDVVVRSAFSCCANPQPLGVNHVQNAVG